MKTFRTHHEKETNALFVAFLSLFPSRSVWEWFHGGVLFSQAVPLSSVLKDANDRARFSLAFEKRALALLLRNSAFARFR